MKTRLNSTYAPSTKNGHLSIAVAMNGALVFSRGGFLSP